MSGVMRPRLDSSSCVTMEIAITEAVKEAVVNVNPSSEPVRIPAPTTPTPAAPAAPASAEVKAKSDAGPESKANVNSRIQQRRVKTIYGRAPDVLRIVVRNVNRIGIGRLNPNCALAILILRHHILLRRRLELAVFLSPGAHSLHRRHDVRLLRKKGISNIGSPTNVGSQAVQYIGENHQRLHTRVPVLLAGCVNQCLSRQSRIVLHPLLSFN